MIEALDAGTLELRTIVFRLTVALLLGFAIGLERQWHQKLAGLRTNTLVSVGAAGFAMIGALAAPAGATPDLRIASQVVSGIGFLGAGVILREGTNIQGINTAATVWCSGMVGVMAGNGFTVAGLCATGFVVGGSFVMRPIAAAVNRRVARLNTNETHYVIEADCQSNAETMTRALLRHALAAAGLDVRHIDSVDTPGTSNAHVTAQVVATGRVDEAIEEIVGKLSEEPFIRSAAWSVDRAFSDT